MTININLFEGWKIRSDKFNYILALEQNNREVDTYFYSSLNVALEGFIDKKIKGFNSQGLAELIQDLKALQTRLNALLQPYSLQVVKGSSKLEVQEKLI